MKIITAPRAAEKLGVHPATLRLWLRKGLVTPFMKLPGGPSLFEEGSLDQIRDILKRRGRLAA